MAPKGKKKKYYPTHRGGGSEAAVHAGALLLDLRLKSGHTREKLAHDACLSVSTLARIELGYEQHPRTTVVGNILRQLDLTESGENAVLRALAGLDT